MESDVQQRKVTYYCFSIHCAVADAHRQSGLKLMQLHWAPRHGVWAGCSFLPDTPYVRELQKRLINLIVST